MAKEAALEISAGIAIPRSELVYRASRAGGAGGQHVNTSSTRIELLWPFEQSSVLSDTEKARVRSKLRSRIDADGSLRVVSANRRSQLQNRGAAEVRLAELLRGAMHVPTVRKKTKPTKASKEARISDKKRRTAEKGKHRSRGI